MRLKIIGAVFGLAMFAAMIVPTFGSAQVPAALAHNVGPCNSSGEPGNSDYAEHHIVPATLGAGASVPGNHGGFSVCLLTGRVFHQP